MEKYRVEATKYTPLIDFDPVAGTLLIEGDSWPENAVDVYRPLLEVLEEYFESGKLSLDVVLKLDYMNTCSSRMMIDIIGQLQSYHDTGLSISLAWYYPAGFPDQKETCEMFLEDVTFHHSIAEMKE